ncbi:hypothetical protein PF007_g960 [Phytophthora fragariae]|uniref:Uncharacterized protein n=3 Tax=Phytophthora fragariae TaxID=53985 RepID=A0A6A3UWU2_9STRA|nr:hypothetical protein PF003_g13407 [Phytophthora fragariae]KAE9139652.1 hypothetical protein PF007_g960 [Phytophthora fragariae]KAE9155124.1 hypothetical protein PF006_g898 [Phytophthora fragariae]
MLAAVSRPRTRPEGSLVDGKLGIWAFTKQVAMIVVESAAVDEEDVMEGVCPAGMRNSAAMRNATGMDDDTGGLAYMGDGTGSIAYKGDSPDMCDNRGNSAGIASAGSMAKTRAEWRARQWAPALTVWRAWRARGSWITVLAAPSSRADRRA